jgi:hypothetical protein
MTHTIIDCILEQEVSGWERQSKCNVPPNEQASAFVSTIFPHAPERDMFSDPSPPVDNRKRWDLDRAYFSQNSGNAPMIIKYLHDRFVLFTKQSG